MLPVTATYQEKVKDAVRKWKGRVQIDYTDPFLDQSITATASENANGSFPEQTADNIPDPPYKWASLDGSWTLDGTYHLMAADGSEQVGWWGKTLSDANGSFVSPYPTLTMTFFSRPIHRIKAVGDSKRGEYPIDFTITLYDDLDNALYQEIVTGNTNVLWEKEITPVNQTVKMVLEIQKWSHPERQVKILEFFTSVRETYEGDDIFLISLQEERDISDGSLPIGNISANEIEIQLNNIDHKFDSGNMESSLYQLLKANRRIKAWIGLEVAPDNTEWVPLGTFWSGDWEVPEGEVYAHTIGRDRMELLRKSTYSISQVIQNTNLYQLAEGVLVDAGLDASEYFVDTELQQFEVSYAWFDPMSHRTALRQVVEACLGQAYADRNGIIRVEGPSFLSAQRTTSVVTISQDEYFDKNQPVKWSEIANYVEVDTVPLRPTDSPVEVYRSNEPDTITAGQTKTLTVYYNEPPVLEATASLEGTGTITNANYYSWGADVTVTSTTDGNFTIVVTGKPLKVINKERVVVQDSESITDNGRLRYKFPDNHLIQKRATAQTIADYLLAAFKNPRRDIELNWRGDPALELADRFSAPDFKNTNMADFHIVSQSMEYDGGLTSTIKGRRAN